jgi:hypothetical protein
MPIKLANMNAKKAKISKQTGKMKVSNADTFVGYLLRSGETGLSCCTEIMTDTNFLQQLNDSYEQQKVDFYKEFTPKKLEYWKNRDFGKEREVEAAKLAADPKYKMKNLDRAEKERDTILRKDAVFQSKPYHVRGGSKNNQKINNIVHQISATQVLSQTRGRIGHEVLFFLPNDLTRRQITHILNAMRKAIPAGYPAVFTLHKDLLENNLHIQGWISSKEWDSSKGGWKSYQNEKTTGKEFKKNRGYFETEAGFNTFRTKCDEAFQEAGCKFKHADDKSLPRVTGHGKVDRDHPFVQQMLRTQPRQDFISGKVLELVNPAGRNAESLKITLGQIGARAKAIDLKIARQANAKRILRRGKDFFNEIEEFQSQMAVNRANRKVDITERQLISKEKYNQEARVEYMDLNEFVAFKEEDKAAHERHDQAQKDQLDALRAQESEAYRHKLSERQQHKTTSMNNVSTEKDLAEALATATKQARFRQQKTHSLRKGI